MEVTVVAYGTISIATGFETKSNELLQQKEGWGFTDPRLDEPFREDVSKLERLAVPLADGGFVPLESVANVYESGGPNMIK